MSPLVLLVVPLVTSLVPLLDPRVVTGVEADAGLQAKDRAEMVDLLRAMLTTYRRTKEVKGGASWTNLYQAGR